MNNEESKNFRASIKKVAIKALSNTFSGVFR